MKVPSVTMQLHAAANNNPAFTLEVRYVTSIIGSRLLVAVLASIAGLTSIRIAIVVYRCVHSIMYSKASSPCSTN